MSQDSASFRDVISEIDKLRQELRIDRRDLKAEITQDIKNEILIHIQPIRQDIQNMKDQIVLKKDFTIYADTVDNVRKILFISLSTIVTAIIGVIITYFTGKIQ